MSIRDFDYSREYRGVDTERPPLQPSIAALNAEIAGRDYIMYSFGTSHLSSSGQRYDPVADLTEVDGQSARGLSKYVDEMVPSSFTSRVRLGTQTTTQYHSIARGREEGLASDNHQRIPLRTPPITNLRGPAAAEKEALRRREYPPSLLTHYLSSMKGANADNSLPNDQTSSSMRWHGIPINSKMAPFAGPLHSFSAGHLAARLSPQIIAAGEPLSGVANHDSPSSRMLTAADGEGGASSGAVTMSSERERKLYERDLENLHRQQAAAKERLRRTVEDYSARQMEYESSKSENGRAAPSITVESSLKDSTDVEKAVVPLAIPITAQKNTVSSPSSLRLMRAAIGENAAQADRQSASLLLDAMLGERAGIAEAAPHNAPNHPKQSLQNHLDQKDEGEDSQRISPPPSSVFSGLRVFVGRGGNLPVAPSQTEMGESGQPIQLAGDFTGPPNNFSATHFAKPQVPLASSPRPRDGRHHQPSATKAAEKTISLPKPANYRTANAASESQTRRSASSSSSSPAGRPSAKQYTASRIKDQNHEDSTATDRAFAAFLYVERDTSGGTIAKASSREKHREASRSRSRSTSKGTRHVSQTEADEFAGLRPPPNASSRQIALPGLGELEALRKQASVHRGRKHTYNADTYDDELQATHKTRDPSIDLHGTIPAHHHRRDSRRLSTVVHNRDRTSISPLPYNPYYLNNSGAADAIHGVSRAGPQNNYVQRPTIGKEDQRPSSENAVRVEIDPLRESASCNNVTLLVSDKRLGNGLVPTKGDHIVATAETQEQQRVTSDTEATRSTAQSNSEVPNSTEEAHVIETTPTILEDEEEKDTSFLYEQQQLQLLRAQQESYNKTIRDAIEAAANAAKLSTHIRGKREEYTQNDDRGEIEEEKRGQRELEYFQPRERQAWATGSSLSNNNEAAMASRGNDSALSYGLNHSKSPIRTAHHESTEHATPPMWQRVPSSASVSPSTYAVLKATSNTHQSPAEHRIEIGDLCALPELRKAVMAFAKEVLLAEIKALTRLREKAETTVIPSTSPLGLLWRQQGLLTERPSTAEGTIHVSAGAAEDKANHKDTESKIFELTSPDRQYSFLRQSLSFLSPTKSDRVGNEFVNRFDEATQRLIAGPEEGNDASLGAVVKSESVFSGDLGRYLGDTPEGVRSGAAFSDVVCSQILASVVTAFTERHTVLTTRLPLSTSLQGEIVLLVRKEMLKASVSYGKHVEEPFLFGSVSRSGAVVGGHYLSVALKSPVIDATNAFAEKNKIMRTLDAPPAAGQRGNAVWIPGKSYANHTAVEAGTARDENTKDAPPFVFSQPVSVTAFQSGGAFPSYSVLKSIVNPDEDLRRSSNISLQHPAAVAIAADLAMNNATVVISEPTFTYAEAEVKKHKKVHQSRSSNEGNLVSDSNKPWKTIVIVASVNRELDAAASPPSWSLSLGNQYATAAANALSAAVVPVDQLVHLRVANTSQVLKTRDQSVFVLELLPGSVRQGHQYTVWFKPTPSSSQTELRTFWVP